MQPQLALIASLIGSFSRGLKTSWSLRAGFVFKAAPSRRGLAPFASLVPSWFGAEPPALVLQWEGTQGGLHGWACPWWVLGFPKAPGREGGQAESLQRGHVQPRPGDHHSCFIFGISSHFKCIQWGLQMAPRYVSVVMETHFSLQTTGWLLTEHWGPGVVLAASSSGLHSLVQQRSAARVSTAAGLLQCLPSVCLSWFLQAITPSSAYESCTWKPVCMMCRSSWRTRETPPCTTHLWSKWRCARAMRTATAPPSGQ